MASISFRDFTLNQSTITGRRNPDVVVDSVRTRYKIDPESGQKTDEVEGYSLDIVAARGKLQTIKTSIELKSTIDKIADALKNDKLVTINFGSPSTLRGRCYALNSNGQLLQGVSATAQEVHIVKIEEQEFEDFDVDM